MYKKPLVAAIYFGSTTFLIGLVSFIAVIIRDMYNKINFLSLEIILAANIMTFGLALYSLGIIGQYLGSILKESKYSGS